MIASFNVPSGWQTGVCFCLPYAKVSEFLGHGLLNILKSRSLQSGSDTPFSGLLVCFFGNRTVVQKVARQTIETAKPLNHRELVLCSSDESRATAQLNKALCSVMSQKLACMCRSGKCVADFKSSQVPGWGRRSATHIPEAFREMPRRPKRRRRLGISSPPSRLAASVLQTISLVAKRLVKKRRIVRRHRLQVASRRPQLPDRLAGRPAGAYRSKCTVRRDSHP
jgi:hypothetical protein